MASFPSPIRRTCRALAGPALLMALVVCLMHRALFSGGRLVPAWPATDLFSVYMPWRYFGFSQWKQGHFPFWNPHVFCGNPFFAQFQSCLLYPITWVNFLFSTATATTLEIAMNLAIGAICMYAWARARGISRCGATLAGIAFPLSGPVYPHMLDGYLTVLSSAAWMPLVFLAVDRLLAERLMSGILIGAIAVCMECLAGHAQLVYYTFLIAGLYVLLESIRKPHRAEGKKLLQVCGNSPSPGTPGEGGGGGKSHQYAAPTRTLPRSTKGGNQRFFPSVHIVRLYSAFAAMWLFGGILAAMQLLPGYLATQLSIRAGGTSYAFASMISLPPENLLTIFIPYPLGGMTSVPYLGRWLLWETSLYVGIVVVVLACIGIADLKQPTRWRMVVLFGAILILMLGAYTPIHWLLYEYLPGFGLFRDPAKFGTLWALWLAILAGHGWDRLRRGEIGRRTIWLTAIAAGICILLAAIVYHFDSPDGPVGKLLAYIYKTRAFVGPEKDFQVPFISELTSHRMAAQWAIAAALLAASSLVFHLRRFSIRPAYFLLVIAIADCCLSAAACNTVSPVQQPFPRQWTKAITTATEHDQRVLFTNGVTYANLGNMLGYDSIWGYDTGQPKRYTELIAASQGEHPIWADQYFFEILRPSRVFQLLRCRYILQWSGKYPVLQVRDPMPRLQLIGQYVRMSDPPAIAAQLTTNFDFRHSAIVEAEPVPSPTIAGTTGRVALLRQSINDLEIEADLPAPALLLITDAYAPGWHVQPIEINNNQAKYDVLQADDVLRAIPLSSGHHHFDLYYRPPGLYAGAVISTLGFIFWIAVLKRNRRLASPNSMLHSPKAV